MKLKSILFYLFIVCSLALQAQDYKVISMESLPLDMTAREHIKEDERGRQCAVLRIATQNITPDQRLGFHFESDWNAFVVERQIVEGEIWVWVSPGLKTLKVKHSQLGNIELHTANYGITVEALHTYKIVIQGTMVPNANEKPEVTQQYLAFQINPTDAILEVNGKTWQVEPDGSAMEYVPFGKYDYQVSLANYHTFTGSVIVDDPENTHKVVVNLLPNFGWIEVSGDGLEDASVYIDNALAGKVPFKSKALKSGRYNIRIVKKMYNDYSDVVIRG